MCRYGFNAPQKSPQSSNQCHLSFCNPESCYLNAEFAYQQYWNDVDSITSTTTTQPTESLPSPVDSQPNTTGTGEFPSGTWSDNVLIKNKQEEQVVVGQKHHDVDKPAPSETTKNTSRPNSVVTTPNVHIEVIARSIGIAI
ncbi:hypothetical protein H072_7442 [Dactylellina haptotyla CBS 200.50]|uniref:Uncharacterized protein n=1 Tax=Dactylellina haptotyla (strain CBS 200.50) TaxID=1284197 RepID=S8ACJ7_DACHA|nr:hypothetical protein H072_7442 [Dactylellina haptotyla CBS 200.50]